MITDNYFTKLDELTNISKSSVEHVNGSFAVVEISFDFIIKHAATALTTLQELYIITYENVARTNAADYDHIIEFIKANEIINKTIYYVNMLLYFH